MPYPQKGASNTYKPRWLGRAREKEGPDSEPSHGRGAMGDLMVEHAQDKLRSNFDKDPRPQD